MRVLLSTSETLRWGTYPCFGTDQIICGPNVPDREINGQALSLQSKRGDYDIAPHLARLRPEEHPDAFVCLADRARNNRPRNLAAVRACKILVIPSLRLQADELNELARYAREEPFDRIVLTGSRRPAMALGQSNVPLLWFPGMLHRLGQRLLDVVRQPLREAQVTCPPPSNLAGSRLNLALRVLHQAKVSAHAWPETLEPRLEFLGHSLAAVVPFERGSLDQTWLEAWAAGTALISNPPDRDDFDDVFAHRDLLACERPEEVAERVAWALGRPAEAAARGRSLAAWFDENLSESVLARAFQAAVANGVQPSYAPELRRGKTASVQINPAWNPTPAEAGLQREAEGLWEKISRCDYKCAHDAALLVTRSHPRFLEGWIAAADAAAELQEYELARNYGAGAERIDPYDPRLWRLARRLKHRRSLTTSRLVNTAWAAVESGNLPWALNVAKHLLSQKAEAVEVLLLRAHVSSLLKQDDSVAAWAEVTKHAPELPGAHLEQAIALHHHGSTAAANAALHKAIDAAPENFAYRRLLVRPGSASSWQVVEPTKDLLITMPETCRRHGTGVLIKRFFPESQNWITLRSQTCYGGAEEFGCLNLLNHSPELSAAELRTRLMRLVRGHHIRHILCIPFTTEDLRHAKAAAEAFGAPLCCYVMDDQNVVVPKIPDPLFHEVFNLSRLRLTISPQMQVAYTEKFKLPFGLMPPVVTEVAEHRANQWSTKIRPGKHAALVGNVWSNDQLKQLLRLVVEAGLTVDWFGREAHPTLTQCNVKGMGFVPETELAARLAEYPFVIVPSGKLDGTEDNEWLTRLSLPSRLVFLLQCGIPLLVLGSPETAAAQFVSRLGLGLITPYEAAAVKGAVRQFADSRARSNFLRATAVAAPRFVQPDAGAWIRASLLAGRTLAAPFTAVFDDGAAGEALVA